MKRALLLMMCGALACVNLAATPSTPQPASAPALANPPSPLGEPMSSSSLYELVFQAVDGPPSGMSIALDGRVLASRPDGSWQVAFTLDAQQLAALQATLDATDVASLSRIKPPEGGRSHPPPSAELRFLRRGTPVVVRVPAYTPQGAVAIEALHQQIQAMWAGAPMSGLVRFGPQEVHLDCDPTAALSLRDALFPLLDTTLPVAAPSTQAPLLSVEWWQGATFIQRYALHSGGRVSRVVPGREDTWRQLSGTASSTIEATLGRLSAESLRAGCP